MVVVGSTTAGLATASYVPPFQPYTSTDPITYVGGPVRTTSSVAPSRTRVLGTPTKGPVNPTVPAIASDIDFLNTYLPIHGLSDPSYRYAYFLWFVLLGLLLLYSILHHLNLHVGPIGALWAKFGMRRRVLRTRQEPNTKTAGMLAGGGIPGAKAKGRQQRSWIWPSNAQVISIALMSVVIAVFCLIGNDYLAANSGTWDLGTSFQRRAVPPVQKANYNIGKTWWTAGGRFGLIAFAMFPLVILFALKAPPFAIFSLRVFTHLFSDKLALMHRWAGRLIWLITTIHVVLWTVQLFKDQRGNGSNRAVWFFMFMYSKFIWAIVGYAAMTAMVATSIKWVRQKYFEVFYGSHLILTVLTLLGSVLHYPKLWYWIAIAAFLWIGERIYRLGLFSWRNGLFGGLKREIPFEAGHRYGNEGPEYSRTQQHEEEFGMKDVRSSTYSYQDKPLPRDPFSSYSLDTDASDMGLRTVQSSYYDQGTYGSRYSVPDDPGYFEDGRRSGGQPAANMTKPGTYAAFETPEEGYTPLKEGADHARQHSEPLSIRPSPSMMGLARAVNIPPGYAYAQLLPSKVVRLTIRMPRPFKWYAGQHVSLYMPEISKWQSHPFSISTACTEDRDNEIILIVKTRKGFTKKLFNETRKRLFAASGVSVQKKARQSLNSVLTLGNSNPPPVLLRAMLDGPFGSAARGKPGLNESIMIVCGGTGVSFGISCLESLCNTMASRVTGDRRAEGSRKFLTRRIRFVWIVREFTEIAWISAQLKRCKEMVSSKALQIDIFVTGSTGAAIKRNASIYQNLYDPTPGTFAPPKPSFAGGPGPRRGSADSVTSQMSLDEGSDLAYLAGPDQPVSDVDPYYEQNDEGIIDLTNYEDEELEEPSALAMEFSQKMRKEGKIRRALSRKRNKKHIQGESISKYQYPPRKPSHLAYTDESVGQSQTIFAADDRPPSAQNDYSSPYAEPRPLYAEQGHASRPSLTPSAAESYSGRYDPFGGSRGVSPAPSVGTYEYDQQSYIDGSSTPRPVIGSQRGSMVLLENAPGSDSMADAGLWMDAKDYESMLFMSEMARPGRPKLDVILQEEIAQAQGTIGVGTCGPASLNALVRNTVSAEISISKAMRGDKTGVISIFSEDYEA